MSATLTTKGRYNPANTILLTGAGFTKSFGGYLGSELWAAILNQPELQSDMELRKEMFEDKHLNFEVIYYRVQHSTKYSDEQKAALTAAIRRAYSQMDAILCGVSAGSVPASAACRVFIRLFSGSRQNRTLGFVFTLNQDLLMERFYINGDQNKMMALPGLHRPEWFKSNVGPLFGEDEDDELKLPMKKLLRRKPTFGEHLPLNCFM